LQIEHIRPKACGGPTEEANLWLSCPACNNYKNDRTSAADPETGVNCELFNPRTQTWAEHFRWVDGGLRIVGLTPTGRATASLLRLADDPLALVTRSYWISVGWHPQRD
jgi:hypothetical protein